MFFRIQNDPVETQSSDESDIGDEEDDCELVVDSSNDLDGASYFASSAEVKLDNRYISV